MASTDFFRSSYHEETSFFDEGPVVRYSVGVAQNTSSIDTSQIDAYRQGVEITQMKHFDAGIVKIHAGEPGHMLRRNRFGMDRNYRTEPVFEELDYFQSELFLRAQELDSPLLWNILTFPIITSDNDQIENYVFDGVIEPLTIRSRASFFSIDVPFEAHDVRGALMGGNTDSTGASDQVLTIYVRNSSTMSEMLPYLDLVDLIGGRFPLNGYFQHEKSHIKPFADIRYPRNVSLQSYDASLESALSLMTGSTDSYIRFDERSATSGWDFDSNLIGTDSLAFGGMTY